MTLKRTLQSICMLTVHPNTTTSVVLQVVGDDGSVSFHSLCLLHLLTCIHISWAVKRVFFICYQVVVEFRGSSLSDIYICLPSYAVVAKTSCAL